MKYVIALLIASVTIGCGKDDRATKHAPSPTSVTKITVPVCPHAVCVKNE